MSIAPQPSPSPRREDLPPRLRSGVEAGQISLEEAIRRARRNHGGFAAKFPAPEARP